jgi:hypothetical protein
VLDIRPLGRDRKLKVSAASDRPRIVACAAWPAQAGAVLPIVRDHCHCRIVVLRPILGANKGAVRRAAARGAKLEGDLVMDSELIAVAARHLERLLIVLAGGVSIYLGYRMFLAIPRAQAGEGKIELPGGVSIYVTRVGPGVFFALFGAVILGLGLYQGLKIEVREQRPGAPAAEARKHPVVTGAAHGSASEVTLIERKYSSVLPGAASAQQGDAERNGALGTVAQLSRLGLVLDGPGGHAIPPQQRNDFALALNDARLRLLASVWDEQAWGPYTDFSRWVLEGESGVPPPRAAGAVRAYRPQP